MKKLIVIFLMPVLIFAEYQYSLEDYNPTSPTYGMDVWNPEYSNFMTLHFFSSQG